MTGRTIVMNTGDSHSGEWRGNQSEFLLYGVKSEREREIIPLYAHSFKRHWDKSFLYQFCRWIIILWHGTSTESSFYCSNAHIQRNENPTSTHTVVECPTHSNTHNTHGLISCHRYGVFLFSVPHIYGITWLQCQNRCTNTILKYHLPNEAKPLDREGAAVFIWVLRASMCLCTGPGCVCVRVRVLAS